MNTLTPRNVVELALRQWVTPARSLVQHWFSYAKSVLDEIAGQLELEIRAMPPRIHPGEAWDLSCTYEWPGTDIYVALYGSAYFAEDGRPDALSLMLGNCDSGDAQELELPLTRATTEQDVLTWLAACINTYAAEIAQLGLYAGEIALPARLVPALQWDDPAYYLPGKTLRDVLEMISGAAFAANQAMAEVPVAALNSLLMAYSDTWNY